MLAVEQGWPVVARNCCLVAAAWASVASMITRFQFFFKEGQSSGHGCFSVSCILSSMG